jgi:AcrR family transcriptional regulator
MSTGPARRGPGRPAAGERLEGETRALILQHAQRLFQERGFSAVSMGDIAGAVGVTKPTLYYYFAHKEDLYTEMVVDILERIGGGLARILHEQHTVEARLLAFATNGLVRVPRTGTMDTMMRDVEIHLPEAHRQRIDLAFQQHVMKPLTTTMQAGIAAGELRSADPTLLAHVWFVLLDAFVGNNAPLGTPLVDDRPALAHHLTHLFLEGAGSARPRV